VFAINEDLDAFVRHYSRNHYKEVSTTQIVICENCSTNIFVAFVNDDDSVNLKCINCNKRYEIGVCGCTNYSTKETKCNFCNREKFNIMHGTAYGEYNQNWEYVVGQCVKCQELLVVSNWHST